MEAEGGRASARFSAELIRQLVDSGHTQTEIAHMLGVGKSYISRVAAGQRALTIEHLATLERALRKPMALLLLEGSSRADDAPERVCERERIRKLLNRPVSAGKDEPLAAEEQAEVDRLRADIDRKLSLVSQAIDSNKGRTALSARPKAPRLSKLRVIKLLEREAGLSAAAARRAYEVQSRFAAAQGLSLFGT
ncbi:MAG: helix-turn-helix transcriptional regulator [Planctomycetota bacterium]|nr:helix-turn-helix transcriptional regulator [Planctomycetota bacterium]